MRKSFSMAMIFRSMSAINAGRRGAMFASAHKVRTDGPILYPLELVAAAREALKGGHREVGLEIPPETRPDHLRDVILQCALIAVFFPQFADGRGFSLARRIRGLGFRGRLRASGTLIADQMRHAMACGFDEIEIDETRAKRHSQSRWLNALRAAPLTYQEGYGGEESILQKRSRQGERGAGPAVQRPCRT